MPALGAEHSKKVAISLTLGQSNTEAHTKAATEKVPLRGWGKYYIHKLSPRPALHSDHKVSSSITADEWRSQ